MHYTYILKSISHPSQIYIGFTANLKQRLIDHNSGKSPHTKKYKPWQLNFYCAFNNEEKAINFEKYLKSGSGRSFTKSISLAVHYGIEFQYKRKIKMLLGLTPFF